MAMQKYGETQCACIVGYGRDQWEDWSILTLEEAERIALEAKKTIDKLLK